MNEFSEHSKRKGLLTQLRSVTLAVPIMQAVATEWLTNVSKLLSDSPLEALQMYSTGGQEELSSSELNSQFLRDLCKDHGDRLVRLAVFRLYVTRDMVKLIADSFPNLEQLYISIAQKDFVSCLIILCTCIREILISLFSPNSATSYQVRRNSVLYTSISP